MLAGNKETISRVVLTILIITTIISIVKHDNLFSPFSWYHHRHYSHRPHYYQHQPYYPHCSQHHQCCPTNPIIIRQGVAATALAATALVLRSNHGPGLRTTACASPLVFLGVHLAGN